MGEIDHRSGRRALRTTLLLLLVAFVAVLVGAGPADRAGAAPKNPPGDPPGNNGTVKIDQADTTDNDAANPPDWPPGKANEPIGEDCAFRLQFFGFDEGQRADITFAAHPPTGGKDPITDPNVLISDDPAGGGQDDDAIVPYDLTNYVRDIEPHAQHGYHIKLTTKIRNADGSDVPGGVKHKVFWIKCSPQPATTLRISKATEGGGPAGALFAFTVECNHRPLDTSFQIPAGGKHDIKDVPPGTVCQVTETANQGAQSTTISENPPHAQADDGQVKLSSGTPTTVTFTNVFPGPGEPVPAPPDDDLRGPSDGPGSPAGVTGGTGTPAGDEATVLGETLTAPDATPQPAATLPRTGTDPAPLTATGLWSLAAGGLALVAGRRLRRP